MSHHHLFWSMVLAMVPLTAPLIAQALPWTQSLGGMSQAPPPEATALAREFPGGTHLLVTDRFLIVHDTTYAWADNRANLLNRAYDQFYRSMSAAGFKPRKPTKRLVCIMFDEFVSYSDYSHKVDRRIADWSGGYYSSRTNRIALFNYLNSPNMKEMASEVNTLQQSLNALHGQLASARHRRNNVAERTTRSAIARTQRQLATVRHRYQAGGGYANIANTIHEAAHMLAFNSGIQVRNRMYPLWFSEGLATCFETFTPAAPFGPSEPNPLRQPTLKKLFRGKKHIRIDELITMTQPPEDKDQRSAAYAQSWGLFHYLFNTQRKALIHYTQTLATLPPGRRSTDQLHHEFTAAFGDPAQVERAVISYHAKRK